jgi:hypothetical protein
MEAELFHADAQTDIQTDRHKELVLAFCNSANAPKKYIIVSELLFKRRKFWLKRQDFRRVFRPKRRIKLKGFEVKTGKIFPVMSLPIVLNFPQSSIPCHHRNNKARVTHSTVT